MKKILFMLIVLILSCQAFAVTAKNGTSEWLDIRSDTYKIRKITIPVDCTADETVTWEVTGIAVMAILDVTGTSESDGTATITDSSGVAYMTFTAGAFAKDGRYIIPSLDLSNNVYGSCYVFGTSTLQLVNCDSADPIIIYIIYKK